MNYEHIQKGYIDAILLPVVFGLLALALFLHAEPVGFYVTVGVAALVFLAALAFGRMTVRGEEEELVIRYGPLPLFRKRFRYASIDSAKRSRSSFIDGWGIHFLPGRGWTYNIWGFDCVELNVSGKTVRIGTDDPDGLLAFIQSKLKTNNVLA